LLKPFSKNLVKYASENNNIGLEIITEDAQAKMSKFFAALFMFLHNYFDDSTKLFSDLYLAKFLDTSVKSLQKIIKQKIYFILI